MGRASRKKPGSGGLRSEHWTDTHPDREHWTPGQLSAARMQTLEEYEALFGRGGPPEPEKSPDLSPEEAKEFRRVRALSDSELLDEIQGGSRILEEGGLVLEDGKNTWVRIGIGKSKTGESAYIGSVITEEDSLQEIKVVYQGRDLDSAVGAANRYIGKPAGELSPLLARLAAEEEVHGLNVAKILGIG